MRILGSKELLAQVRDKDLCVACGACVGICPYHKVYKGKVAMMFACDLSEGSCYAYCPRTEVDFEAISQKLFGTAFEEKPIGFYRKITASKAGGEMSGGSFQNGGTVSALMTLALKKGLIDAAILTGKEGVIPEPQIVTKAEDVVNCASTKYMAAPVISALNQGAKDGYEKMGVVGTACQLTAAGQIKCNPLKKEDFKDSTALAIGVFCTWALDTRQFLNFLAERVDIDTITG
ncbi:4Fe-4S binding protein, partial [bacterium]|nr:4Fe-4S binding protein [bacterium]